MAEKLKSISRQIRWSLLLKAAFFAASWLVFGASWSTSWIFALVALYLYFIPVAQSGTVAGPFFVLLLLTFLEPVSPLFALIFGIVFFYILLIKDLILIDRKSAYEVTILFLIFLLLLAFYSKIGASLGVFSLFYSLCVAVISGYLLQGFLRLGVSSHTHSVTRSAIWLSTLLMWQFVIVGLFIPVDFVYQTVIAFLGSIFIIDLIPHYLFGESSREKVLVTVSILFVLFVFVLGSARWGL